MKNKEIYSIRNVCKFLLTNILAIFLFFTTIPISITALNYSQKTIPLDHLVCLIRMIPHFDDIYGPIIIFAGALIPFIVGKWKTSTTSKVFAFINLIAIPITLIWMFKPSFVPAHFYDENMLPFIYGRITLPVATLLPIASVGLPLLLDYGLLDFVGTIFQPLMRPIFKTPGKSTLDIGASCIGGTSLGVLITNRTYKEGGYTRKEAVIIATGFSTVATSFMVVVSKALGGIGPNRYLAMHWPVFFISTIIILSIVTAITVRLFPIATIKNEGYKGMKVIEEEKTDIKRIIPQAFEAGLTVCYNSKPFKDNVARTFKEGIMMLLAVPPIIVVIGFGGLLLAEYTPIFDFLAFIFLPFTKLLGFGEEAQVLAKGCAITLADMFIPASIVGTSSLFVQMTMAITAIAQIISFSSSIPLLLMSDMEIKFTDLLILWVERTILSLILAALCVRFIYPLFGIPVFG